MQVAEVLFWGSVILLAWCYVGYPVALEAAWRLSPAVRRPSAIARHDEARVGNRQVTVSVLIPCLNAREAIDQRLSNLFDRSQGTATLQVLVGSDGSSDGTAAQARSFRTEGVTVFDFPKRRGRAAVHNDLMRHATGDVVVFTDANTTFDPDFLIHALQHFDDPDVGGVVGRLLLRRNATLIGQAERRYWAYDTWIRDRESRLGLMSFGSGACMLVRRKLVREIDSREDVDFATTMDITLQGARLVFEPLAVAYDDVPDTGVGEFQARARMTSRNLRGVLRRLVVPANWINHPMVCSGIVSRRVIRWCSAPLLTTAGLAAAVLAGHGIVYFTVAAGSALGVGLAAVGYAYDRSRREAPLPVSMAYGFVLASVGMALGVLWTLTCRVPTVYNASQQSTR